MKLHLFAMLLLAGSCFADDVDDALKRSSFAGVVSIHAGNLTAYEKADYSNCGSSYAAYANAERVFVNDIGWVEGYPIEFRSASMLELGGRYLVFLGQSTANVENALRMDREIRTERCLEGGIRLSPILVSTETFAFDALFQEWSKVNDDNHDDGIDYLTYILALSEFKKFFRSPSAANSDPLDSESMEVHTSHGLLHRDAYSRDEVLDLTANRACRLGAARKAPTSDLMIATCE